MPTAYPNRQRWYGTPVLLLILVFVSAPLLCNTMGAMSPACSHPCCPKPAPANSDCMKAGCISTLPLLLPESIAQAVDLPAAPLIAAPVATPVLPDRVIDSAWLRIDPGLFLQNHQILV